MNKNVGSVETSNNESILAVNIIINIQDINDNSPVFVPSNIHFIVFVLLLSYH